MHSQLAGELGTNGQIQQVYLAAVITLFVLLIACVNYVNLATARSAHRAHEVGVRKALGAGRGQLIAQFLGESGLLALLSLLLALCVGALGLPTFARFSTADLSLLQLFDPVLLVGWVAAALGIGLLAGLYPAFFLSASRPVRILRGSMQHGRGVSLRKALIVAQFALSITMTVATGVVYYQLQFLQDRRTPSP